MRLYVKIYFDPEGEDPITIVKKLKDLGFGPVVGLYDFVKEFDEPEDYPKIVKELHEALRGTKVKYTLQTRKE